MSMLEASFELPAYTFLIPQFYLPSTDFLDFPLNGLVSVAPKFREKIIPDDSNFISQTHTKIDYF